MLEELRRLLNHDSPSIPMDEHDQFMFKQHFGPAVGRIGGYVIYTQEDAFRLRQQAEFGERLKTIAHEILHQSS
jgi:hypothetical protein